MNQIANHDALDLYDFDLPNELIAQVPMTPRDASKLLVYKDGSISDHIFSELPNLLPKDAVLVFNNTKVVKARVNVNITVNDNDKGVEIFFLREIERCLFEVLCKPGKLFKKGFCFDLPGHIKAEVMAVNLDGTRLVKVLSDSFNYHDFLDKHGSIPLPPYISVVDNPNKFESQYQTVYAESGNSVAAPTAGLHFTDRLFTALESNGAQIEFVNLQVGLGTFSPIRSDKISEHKMHSEHCYIDPMTASRLNTAKSDGRMIIAVGTTTLRLLESAKNEQNQITSGRFDTDIFITPGYSGFWINGLITNFHLPKSSLFILISALIGIDNAKNIYSHAIDNKYRFFSFGDASLLWLN